jgi:hypothetical protein
MFAVSERFLTRLLVDFCVFVFSVEYVYVLVRTFSTGVLLVQRCSKIPRSSSQIFQFPTPNACFFDI